MWSPQHIASLILKYLKEELSDSERNELSRWRAESPANEQRFRELTSPGQLKELMRDYYSVKEHAWKQLMGKIPELAEVNRKNRVWQKLMIAATLFIAISLVAALFIYRMPKGIRSIRAHQVLADIPAGTSQAVLFVSGGAKVLLDSIHPVNLHDLGLDAQINAGDGRITYSPGVHEQVKYDKLVTPRAGQYQLELADGSRVWLNASSSIRFPETFNGPERIVEMTGEAYFEIRKNVASPFKVIVRDGEAGSGRTEVKVLGTHFNVNAYSEEEYLCATLLEGSIELSTSKDSTDSIQAGKKNQGIMLMPGQQARVNRQSHSISIKNDLEADDAIAWKNGRTLFKNASVPEIMRMISRWYDVDIVYQGTPPQKNITGGISRNASLGELSKVLTLNGVQFTIEGKKIIVKP